MEMRAIVQLGKGRDSIYSRSAESDLPSMVSSDDSVRLEAGGQWQL